jgi:hypothetical protein
MTLRRRLDRLKRDATTPAPAPPRLHLSDDELLTQIQTLLDTAGERRGRPAPRLTAAALPALSAALAAHGQGR